MWYSLSDRIALHVLGHMHPDFLHYTYLERGSDERQYCSPGVDLPVASIMRSKYGMYPEYHTSLDNLTLVTPTGLQGAYMVLQKCMECIEFNEYPKTTTLCEPQLGKYNLYPTLSTKQSGIDVRTMMNLIAYSDGRHSLLDIANKINIPIWDLVKIIDTLKQHGIITTRNVAYG